MNHWDCEVIVVGAGHAGCEAAVAAARLGRRVLLVTLGRDQVGRLSCNPAVGGLAKGALVREIDALGGAMARVADDCTIQFRRLNTRKGLAVQASRAQVDIDLYPRRMAEELLGAGVVIVEGEAADLLVEGGALVGVRLADGRALRAPRAVLTTGTFLGAVMHCGEEQVAGGRVGEGAARQLAERLAGLGLRLGRLKTGTTPRLRAGSIDWAKLPVQPDLGEGQFSFGPRARALPRRDCHVAYTSPATHAIIRGALHRSPMFSGAIEGRGPRYCPSIEDKVVRFPEKERHQLFLEPEGLSTDRVYVNGTSTSLPREVQLALIRSIEGLEGAEILQFGYAVEYDYVDPTQLDHALAFPGLPGLFFAGQVNGTSGYEEAAAQGLLAGANAAGVELRLSRQDAYIGVLVDDLVSRGVGGEPYRMFPSRAEHRLHLREDNADRRLTRLGRSLGLVGDEAWARFSAKEVERSALAGRAPAWLRRPEASWREAFGEAAHAEAAEQVEIDMKYEGYIVREAARMAQSRQYEGVSLDGLDLDAVHGLSIEVRERLSRSRPGTLGAAARVPGVTPAAINALTMALVRRDSERLG